MMSVAMTQFRKLQDSGYARLHLEKDAMRIRGFALAYLGQNDSKLVDLPTGWIPREDVVDYGTNFSRMSDDSAEALIHRGYGVMKKVVELHCPELVEPHASMR